MITIIGTGPAGSYTAYLLAKAGKDVTLIEEHDTIGSPVQCTGIVTHSIEKFFKLPKDVVANRCSKVVVVSKNKSITANVDEIVMWRNRFDQFVADMAEKAGAKILTGTKFISLSKNSIAVKGKSSGKIKEMKTDTIIGADGPSSPVARAANIPHNNRFYIGMQAKVKLKMPADEFETHFGGDFPEFFGWVVPESEDTVRLGLGAVHNAQPLFYKFLEKMTGKREILCWESGIIPIYNPQQQLQRGNVYLIGDAATQVKATTGGGIIPSLKAAHTLTDCIINKKNYHTHFKIESGKELWLHLKLRMFLNKFKDEDYDKLLKLMSKENVQRILKKYDRDTPIPLLLNLAIKEPRFFSFAAVALR
jgi:geranylgeranyl reductase family protein